MQLGQSKGLGVHNSSLHDNWRFGNNESWTKITRISSFSYSKHKVGQQETVYVTTETRLQSIYVLPMCETKRHLEMYIVASMLDSREKDRGKLNQNTTIFINEHKYERVVSWQNGSYFVAPSMCWHRDIISKWNWSGKICIKSNPCVFYKSPLPLQQSITNNLSKLTYQNNSLLICITSDVFTHIHTWRHHGETSDELWNGK